MGEQSGSSEKLELGTQKKKGAEDSTSVARVAGYHGQRRRVASWLASCAMPQELYHVGLSFLRVAFVQARLGPFFCLLNMSFLTLYLHWNCCLSPIF